MRGRRESLGFQSYLPVDHAGSSLLLAVLARVAGDAGTLVPAVIQVHAGAVVGAGARGAGPDIWGQRAVDLSSPLGTQRTAVCRKAASPNPPQPLK